MGLSQYGAYGYAKNGRSYDTIVKHYYQGASIERTSSKATRVLLAASRSTIRFRGVSRIGPRFARPSATYTAKRRGSKVVVYSGRRRVGTFSRVTVYRPRKVTRLLGRAMTGVTSGRYRGKLVLRPGSSGGVTVVNELDIDSYVKGVVAAEMPSSWHPEALKAQAVAARSYARASSPRSRVFDHYPDTRSQVYRGVAGERRSTSRAVKATAREVLTYNGNVITAYFFSTSGGHTENVENIFGGDPQPYLVGVEDRFDDISPAPPLERALLELLAGLAPGRARQLPRDPRDQARRLAADHQGRRARLERLAPHHRPADAHPPGAVRLALEHHRRVELAGPPGAGRRPRAQRAQAAAGRPLLPRTVLATAGGGAQAWAGAGSASRGRSSRAPGRSGSYCAGAACTAPGPPD